MGLVARELESRGIATVCLTLLREVAEKVAPPRSLFVEFGWGQPLGPPGEAALHRRVATAALEMVWEVGETGTIREFASGAGEAGGSPRPRWRS